MGEEVTTDSKASKVVVKGKTADPVKVCERLQRKSGRKVELISPLPKPPEENKEENKDPPKEEEKKEEPPAIITVVLNIRMHCEACAQALQKRIRKIQGVESVETDLANGQVIVKGTVDPAKLVDDVYKKTRKQASIVKDEEKKEEEKKEEEKKEENGGEKKEGEEDKAEDDKKTDVKRSEYWPTKYYSEYAYPPQMFSDENPNACSTSAREAA
ncbi:Heavy metal-associated isoprenylated plant protein 7 [Turnera subulata]|uniref:Heavy metal-associated isoprenylated plant protein 7 n=1 Tax=Turnera subulata TaxID=218843 RepID=A0A9Q0JGP2_9ROSI|nr:Heavy metal-associated isoprenylated plant protein 7 [Turnera subulata]